MTRPKILTRRFWTWPLTLGIWLALLGIWWLVAATQQHNGTLWPEPNQVASTLWDLRTALLQNAGATLHEAALGFAFAVVIAILVAVASHRFNSVSGLLQNIALMVYALPLIALAPVLVLWLGAGLETKVIIAALGSFFPILINLNQALRTTKPQALELMESGGASRLQTFRYVELPYALPMLFASFTVAAPAAIVGAMLSEWVGANEGLGVQLLNAMQEYAVPELYSILIIAGVISMLSYLLFELIGRRLFPWHESLQPIADRA